MDDGGQHLSDVINDSNSLISFTKNTIPNSAVNKDGTPNNTVAVAVKTENTPAKKEVKAKKSVTANKSSPMVNLTKLNTINLLNTNSTMGMSSNTMGMLPVLANGQSIRIQQGASSLNSNSNMMPGNVLAGQAPFQLGPRPMTVLPQQLQLVSGLQMAQPGGMQQIVLAPRPTGLSQSLQSTPMLQIIQTSQGTQIIQASQGAQVSSQSNSSLPAMVTTSSVTTQMSNKFPATSSSSLSSSSTNTRSNKQILPKPQNQLVSSSMAGGNGVPAGMRLISQPSSAGNNFNQPTNLNVPQFVIGSGPQQQLITGPQGTFIVNNVMTNLGSQQFLIQGNVQNPSMQLAIRPQAPLIINSNSLGNEQHNLSIGQLGQVITSKAQSQTAQSFVLSNTGGSGTSANNLLVTSNNNLIIRPSLLNAQQQSQLLNAQQQSQLLNSQQQSQLFSSQQQTQLLNTQQQSQLINSQQQPPLIRTQQPPQFLQVQTANGPILLAVNSGGQSNLLGPTLGNMQPQTIQLGNTLLSLNNSPSVNLQNGTQPMQSMLNKPQENTSLASSHLIQTNVSSMTSTLINTTVTSVASQLSTAPSQTVASDTISVAKSSLSPTNKQKGPSLDLADLLKETGILTDFSPPESPQIPTNTTTNNMQTTAPTEQSQPLKQATKPINQQTTVPVSGELGNTVPKSALPPGSQPIRLVVTADGNLVVLPFSVNPNQLAQPAIGELTVRPANVVDTHKDSNGMSSSQPSPDSTTPNIDPTSSPSMSTPQVVQTVGNSVSIGDAKSNLASSNYNTLPLNGTNIITSQLVDTTGLCQLVGTVNNRTPSETSSKESCMPSSNPLMATCTSMGTVSVAASLPVLPSVATVSCDTSFMTTTRTESLRPTVATLPITIITSHQTQATKTRTCTALDNQTVVGLQPETSWVMLTDTQDNDLAQFYSNNKSFMQHLDNQLTQSLNQSGCLNQKDKVKELAAIKQMLISGQSGRLAISLPTIQLLKPYVLPRACKSTPRNRKGAAKLQSNTAPLSNSTNKPNEPQPKMVYLQAGTIFIDVTESNTESESSAVESNQPQSSVGTNQTSNTDRQNISTLKSQFQQTLTADQNSALNPDCNKPFSSRTDAIKRLMSFHVVNHPSLPTEEDLEHFDQVYENMAQILLEKKSHLYDRFRFLSLEQSLRDSHTCEQVMLGRLFAKDEEESQQADRQLIASGKTLNLPPLPKRWLNCGDGENLEEDHLNDISENNNLLCGSKRKLPLDFEKVFNNYDPELDFDIFGEDCSENDSIPDDSSEHEMGNIFQESDPLVASTFGGRANVLNNLGPDETTLNEAREQDIEFNVEDFIRELNSQTSNDEPLLTAEQQNFLDSIENMPLSDDNLIHSNEDNSINMVTDDLQSLYAGIESTGQQANVEVSSQITWTTKSNAIGIQNNTNINELDSNVSWNASAYSVAAAEAEVAVQSIIDSVSPEQQDNDLPVDFSGLEDFDIDQSVNFDDLFQHALSTDNGTTGQTSFTHSDMEMQQAQQQGFDVQMHCAIKSIMLDSSSGSGQRDYFGRESFHYSSNSTNNGDNYEQHSYHLSSHQLSGNGIMSSVSDTLLDEAVKSIL